MSGFITLGILHPFKASKVRLNPLTIKALKLFRINQGDQRVFFNLKSS